MRATIPQNGLVLEWWRRRTSPVQAAPPPSGPAVAQPAQTPAPVATLPKGPWRVDPPCSQCGRPAATIELIPDGELWRMRYAGPGGGTGLRSDAIPTTRAAAIHETFTEPVTAASIGRAGLYDDAGFCRPCGAFYCPAHWRISDIGTGRCPADHVKSLDPHWSPE